MTSPEGEGVDFLRKFAQVVRRGWPEKGGFVRSLSRFCQELEGT